MSTTSDPLVSGRSWGEALGALLAGLGAAAEDCGAGPADLDAALRGLGLEGRVESLRGADIPDAAGGGVLVEMADGGWVGLRAVHGGFVTARGVAVVNLEGWDLGGRIAVIAAAEGGMPKPMRFIRRYKGRVAQILLGGLLVNLFSLCFPLFGAFVYDKVVGNGITETLWALTIGLGIVIGLDFAIRAIRALLVERFTQSSEADIDRTIFDKVLGGNVARLPSVGRVLDQYKQILGSRDFLSSSAMLAAVDVPFLVLFLATVAWIGGVLVLVPLVLGAAMLALQALLAVPMQEAEAAARKAGEARFALLADALAAREAVVGGRLADALRRGWRRASVGAGVASGRSRFWHALGYAASASFTNLAYVGVIVVGANLIDAHEMTTGRLLACSILTSRAMGAMAAVVNLVVRYRELRHAMAAMDATLPTPPAARPVRPRGRLKGEIRVSNVTCRLRPEGAPALDGVDVRVAAGEMIGIAGRPGAGKTTLLRVLAGALAADAGEVAIDTLPLAAIGPDDLSLNVGYKPQEPCLFEGTLEDNLRLGREGVGAGELEAALAAAGLMPALAQGELGLATEVGPRGGNLSGGQRQMLSLARALVGDPAVLLLDEPTTGMDAQAEQYLATQLAARKGAATVLVSTHSRVVLSQCDRILVLDRGKVVAFGPRDRVLVGG